MKHMSGLTTSRATILTLLPIIAASTLLAVYNIPQTGFWLDELYSYYFASIDFRDLFYVAKEYETNMSLYYVLLHAWTTAGHSVVFIKSLSILFAVSAIVVIYYLGSAIHSKRAGLYAAALLGINPFFLIYAQEARSYSLTVFLTALAAFAFLRLYQGSRSRMIGALFVCSAILSLYSHLFSALVLASLYAGLLLTAPKRLFSKNIIVATVLVIAGGLPLILVALTNAGEHFDWLHRPTWHSVLRLLYTFTSGESNPVWLKRLVLAVFLVPCIWSLSKFLQPKVRSEERSARLIIYIWLVVPVALVYYVSLKFPVFHERYLIICLIPLILTAAMGFGDMENATLRKAVLALLMVLFLVPTFAFRARYTEDWRSLYATVAAKCAEPAMLYFHPDLLRVTYPYFADHPSQPGACNADVRPEALTPESLISPNHVAISDIPLEGLRQVWLVFAHDEFPAMSKKSMEIQEYMDKNASRKGQWAFSGNLRLILYEPNP